MGICICEHLGCCIAGTISRTDLIQGVCVLSCGTRSGIDTEVVGIKEGVFGTLSHALIVNNIKRVIDVFMDRASDHAGSVGVQGISACRAILYACPI